MQKSTKNRLSGTTLALAAATLLSYSATAPQEASAASAEKNTTDLAHCYGVNTCKGHNDCGGADNSCAGHGSCKGQGFVSMPTQSCDSVGGTVKDAWRGTVNKADLVNCYGVSACKGKNDCQTAGNACKGHGSCKGKGYVSMGEKACKDIGGKASS